jgi:hypothetical protein
MITSTRTSNEVKPQEAPAANVATQEPIVAAAEQTQEVVATVPANVADFNALLKEKSGGYFSDEAQFNSHVEKIKSFGDLDTVISERDTISQKAKELEDKYSKISQEVEEYKPANEFVSALNSLIKKGANEKQIQEFYQLSQTDLSQLTPQEAKIMRLQRENALSREDAEFEVGFGLDETKHDEDTVRKNNIALKREFNDNIAWLEQQRKSLSEVPKNETQLNKEAQDQERQNRIEAVKKLSPSIAKEIDKMAITIPVDKDKNMEFEYVLGDDFKEKSTEIVQNLIINNNVDINDPKQLKSVQEQAKRLYIATNPERYATAVIKHYESLRKEEAALENAKTVSRHNGNQQAVIVSNGNNNGRATIKFHDLKPIK